MRLVWQSQSWHTQLIEREVPRLIHLFHMARRTSVAAVLTPTTKMNQSSLTSNLPIFSPQFSTPLVSGFRSSSPRVSSSLSLPLSHNQYPHISHEDLQEVDRLSNNPDLAFLVGVYVTYNNQLLDMYTGLKQSVKVVLEGRTLTGCSTDTLAAIMASHEQMVGKVMVVLANQQGMRESQNHFGATLEAEILVKNRRKDHYYTMFASLAALSGASVFFAVKLYPESLSLSLAIVVAVFAAVLSIVFYRLARRTDTNHDQLMNPVKKNKDIIEVTIGDNRLALCHLTSIKDSANGLHSQIKSILEMVGSGAAMESNVIVTRLAALELGFQKLEREVDWCIMDAYSSRQGVVQTINI